jgi:hypothetical protein
MSGDQQQQDRFATATEAGVTKETYMQKVMKLMEDIPSPSEHPEEYKTHMGVITQLLLLSNTPAPAHQTYTTVPSAFK